MTWVIKNKNYSINLRYWDYKIQYRIYILLNQIYENFVWWEVLGEEKKWITLYYGESYNAKTEIEERLPKLRKLRGTWFFVSVFSYFDYFILYLISLVMCILLLCFAMYDTEYGCLGGRSVGFNVYTLALFYNVS